MAAISSTSYFSSQPQLPASTAKPSRGGRQPRGRWTRSCVMLKSCLDLGFGFAYHEIPELCNKLPGLELCYSMTRRFLDEQRAPGIPPAAPPIPNWRISGPGDDPEEVKAQLKYWAQTVSCTVKLCS